MHRISRQSIRRIRAFAEDDVLRNSLLLVVLLWPSLSAGEVTHISHPARPVVTANGKFFSGTEYMLPNAGEPRLPYECYYVVLPHGEIIDNVDVTLEHHQVIDGEFDIPCAQMPYPIGHPATISPRDPKIYGTDESYPIKDWELLGVKRLSGVDIAIVTVFPYKYNPVRRELSYYRKVVICLGTSPDAATREQQSRMICRSKEAYRRWEELTVNPELVSTYPEENAPSRTRDVVDPGDPSTFLIIAGEDYLSVFNDYAVWKESHGVSAAVYTIEDIYTDYTSGVDNAENLRAFIIDAYQTWAGTEHPLEYVLLAGDDEIIPIRGCWGHNEYYGTDYNIPCDLYYGALDGDWNANGNAYYGEVDDDPDLFPEVHVGRFPGDNQQDFENMISKIQHHVEVSWPDIHTVLMVGEKLNDNPLYWGGDFLDLICDDTNYMPGYYDVTKMYQRDGTFSTSAVTQHVNGDSSAIIYHCAHTNYNYLLGWSPADIDNLQNSEYPFFSPGGCHTLAFDQATSGNVEAVGEHALFAEGAMMAFLGHSRYGFSNWTNFIQKLMEGIFVAQVGAIGASLTYSRDQLAYLVPTHELWRWEYYELIFAGDPEIHLLSAGGCDDDDHDGVCDSSDNCGYVFNPGQVDTDADNVGNPCDNCSDTANPDQADTNGDGIGDACCCVDRGNVDGVVGVGGPVDVADLTYLVAYLFQGGPAPPCPEQANVDSITGAGGPVDVADLTCLVAYLFQGGLPPAECP